MKSFQRCKAHFQGDRCKKERFHDSDFSLDNSEEATRHQGSFTIWKGSGDSKTVLAKAQGAVPRVHRNRRLNRFLRVTCDKNTNVNLMSSAARKSGSALLGLALKVLRGEKLGKG